MPCGCKSGKCKSCACAKANQPCTSKCHGGDENDACTRVEVAFASAGLAQDPRKMSISTLKKECAQRGINPDDLKDNLVADLIAFIKSGAGSGGGGADLGGEDDDAPLSAASDPVTVAKRIIGLGSRYEEILRVLGAQVTSKSPPGRSAPAKLERRWG